MKYAMTLEEVGLVLGVSGDQVGKIEARALEKLRKYPRWQMLVSECDELPMHPTLQCVLRQKTLEELDSRMLYATQAWKSGPQRHKRRRKDVTEY